jgi:hypothetical protein
MKVRKYVAAALCLCLLLCGCSSADRIPTRAETEATLSKNWKTDAQWNDLLSYADYLQMPAAERSAFADSFDTVDEFKVWLGAVMRIYEAEQDKSNQVGEDGVIDMGDIAP